jgi:outer membrane protein OmpA-like peptidoglycan-associated protein
LRRALLLAVGTYRDPAFTALKFPLRDAERVRSLLADTELCGFDQVDVIENPTRSQAARAIEDLTSRSASEDFILLYFSGHGKLARDGSLAIVFADTEENYLNSSALVDGELRALFNAGRATRKVIILDCCHAGAVGEEGFKRAASDAFESMAQQAHGTFVLTASTKFQPAFECKDLAASVLTHTLIEGVRSGAMARPGADAITLSDLGEYLMREVPKRSSQQPKFWDFGGVGATPLARVVRRLDAGWEKSALAALRRMLADDVIDDELFDEARAAMRASPGSARTAALKLVDELVEGKLRPLAFKRRMDVVNRAAAPPPRNEPPSRDTPTPEAPYGGPGVEVEEEPSQMRRLILPAAIGTVLLAGTAFFTAGTPPRIVDVANLSENSIIADGTLQPPLVNGNARVDAAPDAKASAPPTEGPPPAAEVKPDTVTVRPRPARVAERPIKAQTCSAGPFLVFFDWSTSSITPQAAAILDNAANAWQQCGGRIYVTGYTDSSLDDAGLGAPRARAVRTYLTGQGVPRAAITADGGGRTLVEPSDDGREPQNRRAEVTFGPA